MCFSGHTCVEPKVARQHISDAAWAKAGPAWNSQREYNDANCAKVGCMLVTVEEWQRRDYMSVSFESHQETVGEFQNQLAAKDTEIDELKAQLARAEWDADLYRRNCEYWANLYVQEHKKNESRPDVLVCPASSNPARPAAGLLTVAPYLSGKLGGEISR